MSLTQLAQLDRTPGIRWTQRPIRREPHQPVIDHALWLLRRWNPPEDDFLANEAIWTIEQLTIMLDDHAEDARSAREVLQRSMAFAYEQNRELDRLRARNRRPFTPDERQEPLDPAYMQEISDWLATRREPTVVEGT